MEENNLSKIFRLCYVDDDLMYFTDNFANCIGDDWNDSPYEHNSPYSVEDINNGAIAWLFQDEAGGLMGGATIKETKEWMKKAKVRFGELKL